MQVKLRVIGGKNDGREIPISILEFVIGRGEGVHLRPNSDLISRRHCAIRVQKSQVVIEDFKSRNGTFVNGGQITGAVAVKHGDVVRVGRLQFEMVIDPTRPGMKKPKVEGVAEAAQRAAGNGKGSGASVTEDSITDWLAEPSMGGADQESFSETRQFRLDDTHLTSPIPQSDTPTSDSGKVADSNESLEESDSKVGKSKKKKSPGKLPERPQSFSENTKDAADDVLRRFFNQR